MTEITRLADKAGFVGTLLSAMACGACFPAIASLGAAVGMGFLQQYEGVFVSTLLPLFAAIALIANGFAWFRHRQWRRSVMGVTGPVLVLSGVWLMLPAMLYAGLIAMLLVSVWDLVSPANLRCNEGSCEVSTSGNQA